MSIGTILVILLVLILLGGLGSSSVHPGWQSNYQATGTVGTATAALGSILLILIILLFAGETPMKFTRGKSVHAEGRIKPSVRRS